ncbi:unnamed protein product [Symbiodinium sp. CCMP2456]|nr:unnamed protein product [Symbiodinium sp. CCMP2456]
MSPSSNAARAAVRAAARATRGAADLARLRAAVWKRSRRSTLVGPYATLFFKTAAMRLHMLHCSLVSQLQLAMVAVCAAAAMRMFAHAPSQAGRRPLNAVQLAKRYRTTPMLAQRMVERKCNNVWQDLCFFGLVDLNDVPLHVGRGTALTSGANGLAVAECPEACLFVGRRGFYDATSRRLARPAPRFSCRKRSALRAATLQFCCVSGVVCPGMFPGGDGAGVPDAAR